MDLSSHLSIQLSISIKLLLGDFLLLKHTGLVGKLKGVKLLSNLFILARLLIVNFLELLLLLVLVLQNFSVLILLIIQILVKFLVLLVGKLKAVACVVSKLLNKQESLNGLSLNLTVVVLEDLQIVCKGCKLLVEELSQEFDILSL